MRRSLWVGAALLVIGAAAFAGVRYLAIDEKRVGDNPTFGLEALAFELVNGDRETEGEIWLPISEQWRKEESVDWMVSVVFETWGIRIADISGASVHLARFEHRPLAGDDPEEFLAALAATGHYRTRSLRSTEIARAPAVSARVTARVDANDPTTEDRYPHLDINEEGGVFFDQPNQTVVTAIDGKLYLIQFWANSEAVWEEKRAVAESVLASVRLGA